MVDLPEYPRRLALTEGPRSGISPADIAAPYAMFARAAGNLADAVAPIAEEQAMAAGAESVGRDANGNLVMVSGPAFGRLGEVYTRAARSSYLAQLDGEMDRKFLELRQQSPNDPVRFDGMAKAYGTELVAREKDPILKASVRAMAEKGRTQHFIGMSREKQQVDLGNAKVALETRVKANDDKMSALARQGGTSTPEYLSLMADQKALYGELQANPQWGYNPAVVDDQMSRGEARHKAETFLGLADRVYQEKGYEEAYRTIETQLRDPGLNLTEAERNQYLSQAGGQIAKREAWRREDVREVRTLAEPTIAALRQGVGGLDDDAESMAKRLEGLGDPGGAARLRAAAEFNRGMRGMISTPTRQWPSASLGDVPKVPALATARAGFGEELQDPAVKARLAALTQAEVGGQGPAAQQAFIETIMNRAAARGQTLAQTMTGDYFPQVTHQRTAQFSTDAGVAARYDGAITNALAGSNVGRFATGNASGTVGFNGGPGVAAHGGERFGIEGPDQEWARRMGAGAVDPVPDRTSSPPPAFLQGQQEGARKAWTAFHARASETVGRWGLLPDDAAWMQSVAPYLTPQQRQQGRELFDKAQIRGALDSLSPDQQNALHASLAEEAAAGAPGAQQMLKDYEEMQAQTAAREQKDPMGRGIDAGWTQGPKAIVWAAPVDQVAAGMTARAKDARIVAGNLGREAVPALQPSEAASFAGALRQNPALLTTMEALDPATYAATMSLDPVKDALAGMVRSNDYGKMSAALASYDKMWAADPAGFAKAFGTAALDRLQDWQAAAPYMTSQEAVEFMRKVQDPSMEAVRKVRAAEVHKVAPKVEEVLGEIGGAGGNTTLGRATRFFGQAAVWGFAAELEARDPGIHPNVRDAFYQDYLSVFSERYKSIGDKDLAAKQALERIKQVWGASEANGGRLMKHPPEVRPEYPAVGGSKAYIGEQMRELVATKFPAGAPAQWSLVSDRETAGDIAAGRAASYGMVYAKKDGTLDVLREADGKPSRVFFDPSKVQAEREALGRRGDVWSRMARNLSGDPNKVNVITGEPLR